MKIKSIEAREILDSRGNPTVATAVELEDGVIAEASVPSGASTGSGEALELRDGDANRFGGLGVLTAVRNVNMVIGPVLLKMDAGAQAEIDQKMLELDGTENKSSLGANAILSVSLAIAKAEALSRNQELFEYLAELYGNKKKLTLPCPMFNIVNGGAHAENKLDIQEMMVVPVGLKGFEQKLRAGAEIEHLLKTELKNKGFSVGLGDEGGFAPEFTNNEAAIDAVYRVIEDAGYKHNEVRISLDIAATEFASGGNYILKADGKSYASLDFIKYLKKLKEKYNLYSIEDGLAEHDENWKKLTQELGPTVSVGDDLFTTNPEKIELGAKEHIATGVIIKPNQIGTLTETLEAVKKAQEGGLTVIISHRSGETEDSFIADLAVAVGAPLIKAGAPARSERLAKYNRLTKIEDLLLES